MIDTKKLVDKIVSDHDVSGNLPLDGTRLVMLAAAQAAILADREQQVHDSIEAALVPLDTTAAEIKLASTRFDDEPTDDEFDRYGRGWRWHRTAAKLAEHGFRLVRA